MIKRCFLLFLSTILIGGAPVYSFSKAMTTEAKKQRVLEKKIREAEKQFLKDKKEALELAKKRGWVIKKTYKDGSSIELMRVENGRPVYYTTFSERPRTREYLVKVKAVNAEEIDALKNLSFEKNKLGPLFEKWGVSRVKSPYSLSKKGSRNTDLEKWIIISQPIRGTNRGAKDSLVSAFQANPYIEYISTWNPLIVEKGTEESSKKD